MKRFVNGFLPKRRLPEGRELPLSDPLETVSPKWLRIFGE
jgi:hypothetical protein